MFLKTSGRTGRRTRLAGVVVVLIGKPPSELVQEVSTLDELFIYGKLPEYLEAWGEGHESPQSHIMEMTGVRLTKSAEGLEGTALGHRLFLLVDPSLANVWSDNYGGS